MPVITSQLVVGPQAGSDGAVVNARGGRSGEGVFSELNGRYYEQSVRGNTFMAHAIVTAPVIYTTAAGTGGPFLWNGSTNVNAVLLGAGVGVTVVTTVAAALGITGNTGQNAVPTATTVIDSRANLRLGGAASACTPYRVATPATAGSFFLPFAHLHTGALTVDTMGVQWFDLGGLVVIPPGGWAAIAASVTATTTVAQLALVWTEVPV